MITSSSGGQSVNDLSQLLNVPNGGLIMNLILAGHFVNEHRYELRKLHSGLAEKDALTGCL